VVSGVLNRRPVGDLGGRPIRHDGVQHGERVPGNPRSDRQPAGNDQGEAATADIEGLTSADYLVRQHIPAYTLAFDRLRVASLGDRESLAIINTIIDELEE
jgi:hypothetical protein